MPIETLSSDDLTPEQTVDVTVTFCVGNALNLEASQIAQRQVGTLDSNELHSIVVALATIYAALAKLQPVLQRAGTDATLL